MTAIPESIEDQLDADWTGAGGAEPTYYIHKDWRSTPPLGKDAVWILSYTLRSDTIPMNDDFADENHTIDLIVNTSTSEDRLKELADEVVRILNATALTGMTYQRVKKREIVTSQKTFNYQEKLTFDMREQMKDSAAAYGSGTTGDFAVVGDMTVAGTLKNNADNEGFYIGAGDDLRLYHSGSFSFWDNSTGYSIFYDRAGGHLIRTGGVIQLQDSDDGNTALFNLDTSARTLAIGTAADPVTFTLNETTEVSSILDEDNMASDSATALATQQSIKKYVDDNAGGGTDSFKTITGITNDVVADSTTDTLTLASGGANLTIVGTAATDTITFSVVDAQIDHDALTNFDANEHLLTAAIDHDALLNFVANEHLPGIDEDDMVSDSAAHVPTQQSVKKYVDDNAGGAGNIDPDQHRYKPLYSTDYFHTLIYSNPPWYGNALASGTFTYDLSLDHTVEHFGIAQVKCSTSANSGYRNLTAMTDMLIQGNEAFEIIFYVLRTTDTVCRMGFQDQATTTLPTDGAWIHIAGTTLDGRTANNTSRSTTGTNYTITANTWYRARIIVNSDATSIAYYLYNMAGTELWTNTLAADIPTGTGRNTGHGWVIYNTGSGTAYSLVDIDYMAVWKEAAMTR